jgi:hypothetical protein
MDNSLKGEPGDPVGKRCGPNRTSYQRKNLKVIEKERVRELSATLRVPLLTTVEQTGLDWRTFQITVTAKNAAISFFWLEKCFTFCALIEKYTGACRHLLNFLVFAPGTGND